MFLPLVNEHGKENISCKEIARKLHAFINPPATQCLEGLCSVDGHSIPAGQSVHTKLPISAYWPGSHGTGYACGMHKRRRVTSETVLHE